MTDTFFLRIFLALGLISLAACGRLSEKQNITSEAQIKVNSDQIKETSDISLFSVKYTNSPGNCDKAQFIIDKLHLSIRNDKKELVYIQFSDYKTIKNANPSVSGFHSGVYVYETEKNKYFIRLNTLNDPYGNKGLVQMTSYQIESDNFSNESFLNASKSEPLEKYILHPCSQSLSVGPAS